tara:strand:- start:118 stop:579 length:462 start_codon:yes stop_codon:yes gene_type:complete
MNQKNIRIGIDFGKTIGLTENDKPFPNCYSVIKFFKNKFGIENIYVISKAKKEMRIKISEWLLKNNFFEETNFLQDHVIFCNEYDDKTELVKKLKINIFIDDHIKVIQNMVKLNQMDKVIWFNKNVDLKLIDKKYRSKIILTNKWNRIIKIFQ